LCRITVSSLYLSTVPTLWAEISENASSACIFKDFYVNTRNHILWRFHASQSRPCRITQRNRARSPIPERKGKARRYVDSSLHIGSWESIRHGLAPCRQPFAPNYCLWRGGPHMTPRLIEASVFNTENWTVRAVAALLFLYFFSLSHLHTFYDIQPAQPPSFLSTCILKLSHLYFHFLILVFISLHILVSVGI
jgi:hypothetical protein